MPATGARSRKKIPNPAATPRTAAAVDSMAASRETCLRVAPTRRIAANRCSRRAADSRVAVAMKISTGASMASATTDRIRSMPLAWIPAVGRGVVQALGVPAGPRLLPGAAVVAIDVTCTLSGVCASCAGVRPTMMTSEFGDGSAASPIMPGQVAGVAVGQLVRRGAAQQRGERRRGVVLARSRVTGDARRHR